MESILVQIKDQSLGGAEGMAYAQSKRERDRNTRSSGAASTDLVVR
jgi:hypothetical protein